MEVGTLVLYYTDKNIALTHLNAYSKSCSLCASQTQFFIPQVRVIHFSQSIGVGDTQDTGYTQGI